MNNDAPFEPNRRQWIGFWNMIVQQTQNAFNDKMAQFILIPLGGAVGFTVENAAGLMIALPFVLFAPLAGWLSDRHSKRDVMFGTAIAQLAILLWISGALFLRNLPMALAGFFALAAQSAFFSPAKIGMNKELLGSKHVGFAAGIQQMTTMLAILAGQIVAGWWFDHRYMALGGVPDQAWAAGLVPMLILAVTAVPTLLLAWTTPRVPPQGNQKFELKMTVSHFVHLADLWRDRPLRQASFGVAYFWGFAAFINLWSVKLAKLLTGGGEGFGTLSSLFMAFASLGMAGGFGFASYLLRKRIELGWVPLAGLAMTASSLALALLPPGNAEGFLRFVEFHPGRLFDATVSFPQCALFLLALALLAFFSAIFLAPLNGWMQDRYPAAKRGELQAAVNLQDCFAGIIAVAIIMGFEAGMSALGIAASTGFRLQMLFIALTCLSATLLIIRILPADFLRVIGVFFIRLIYRIRVSSPERLPAKGGVLLLPNHVSYADAFFISAASPRPLRFVMDEVFMARPAIRVFTRIFNTLTIRRDQPLEAIREIIRALQEGDAVVLFPEGQLTRTGTLCQLERGFELIARKTGHPLIPLWCDGSWGSIFSFERNHFISKKPNSFQQDMVFAFGMPMASNEASVDSVRHALMIASAEAIDFRFRGSGKSHKKPAANNRLARIHPPHDGEGIRRMWINGHQIGMVNALQRRQAFHVLADDPLLLDMPGLFIAFPELFGAEVKVEPHFIGDRDGVWVGGDLLRQSIEVTQITSRIRFHDFGAQALTPVDRAGLCHCPGLAVAGMVVAMSMPHPPVPHERYYFQSGHKPHSWGKILPGWYLEPQSGATLRAHGPAAQTTGLALPPKCTLDPEGFLIAG